MQKQYLDVNDLKNHNSKSFKIDNLKDLDILSSIRYNINDLYIVLEDIKELEFQNIFKSKIILSNLELECPNLSSLNLFNEKDNERVLDTLYLYNIINIENISGLCNNISISYCERVNFKVQFFTFIQSLNIKAYNNDIDISHMKRLKELKISIKGVVKGRNSSLERLKLEFLDIEDVNFIENYPNLKSVIIENCSNLKCIEKLDYLSLKNIEINKCDKLKDEDFYNITNSLKVSLKYCPNFKDVYKFKNKKELDFTGCINIKNLSCLESNLNLYYLNLSYTPIRHVFSFKNVYHLVLRGCKRIKSIKGLEEVKILDLYDCCGIEDFSGLKNNLYVNLTNTNFHKDLNNFKYIENIQKIELNRYCFDIITTNPDIIPNHYLYDTENTIYIKKINK